uniref:Putative tick transposon n=1 Tax=Rhipicephalus microplus TaxID=6941 RepID=A0A6G5ABG0_RHIMP
MVPPRLSISVAVTHKTFSEFEAFADNNTALLLQKGICMARGLVKLRDGCANVLLTNLGNEVQHVAKGTVIASRNDFVQVTELHTFETNESDFEDVESVLAAIDIEPGLLPSEKEQIEGLLREFAECFSLSSKVRRTPIAKHRIIVDESVRPIHQHPYRVSPREREAIGNQVKEMLKDDVIQPSSSPWASPVVLVKKKTKPYVSALIIGS